jgi:hypothetical protein
MLDTEYQKTGQNDSDLDQGIDDMLIEMKNIDERIKKHQEETDALGVETSTLRGRDCLTSWILGIERYFLSCKIKLLSWRTGYYRQRKIRISYKCSAQLT